MYSAPRRSPLPPSSPFGSRLLRGGGALPVFAALLAIVGAASAAESSGRHASLRPSPPREAPASPRPRLELPAQGLSAQREDEEREAESSAPSNLVIPATVQGAAREQLDDAIRDAMIFAKTGGDSPSKVIRALRSARKKADGAVVATYYIGKVLLKDEKYSRARKEFEKVIAARPGFHEAYVALGDVARREFDLDEAARQFEKALALAPDDVDGLESKFDLLMTLGKLEEADAVLAHLQKVSEDENLGKWREYIGRAIAGPGWSRTYVSETDNYVVRTCISQEYADEIASCAEQVRKLYAKYFIDVPRVGRKYEILVYRDKNDYQAHGGPPTAGGHYSPILRNLNLFKYENRADTMVVLYHEGFHQYLHEYFDGHIPQWFNEGLGDFFGGALISPTGRKARMSANPWRIDTVKRYMNHPKMPAAEELMNMTRAEMYSELAGLYYAQAWAIVYYCMEGGKSSHKKALLNYFAALRKGRSQRQAFDAAFGRVDMKRFEKDWRNFADRQPSAAEIRDIVEKLFD